MRRIGLLVLIAWTLAACPDDAATPDMPAERAILVDGILSFGSVAELEKAIGRPKDEWRIVKERALPPTDPRPPFAVLTVRLEGHRTGGYRGALVATFFNGLLMETLFYPDDPAGYQSVLAGLLTGDEAEIGRYTRLWRSTDYAGITYFGWRDRRLSEALDAWIRRYA